MPLAAGMYKNNRKETSMENYYERLEALYGTQAVAKLKSSKVAVFGVGGVGGHVVEALARSAVGQLDLFDSDIVAESNLNRQIIATIETIGMKKTDAAKLRVKSIAPDCTVNGYCVFYCPEKADEYDLSKYDYVIDALDHIPAKIELAVRCEKLGIAHISAMGAGNKLHPELMEIADIYKTEVCPLARIMRRELRGRGVKKLLCVYSKEQPQKSTDDSKGKRCPASNAFVPATAGLIIASCVVNYLTGNFQ